MKFKLKVLYYYLLTRYLRQFRSRQHLERWQNKKVSRFTRWAMKRSPFYAMWFGSYRATEWKRVTPINKQIMMEHFSLLNTVKIDREEALKLALNSEESRNFSPTLNGITIGLSSGTSGNRGLFLASDHERARHAGTIMAKILPDSIFSKNRVAFFMRANSNLYTSSQSSKLQFEFFDLLIPIEKQLKRLQDFDPTLLFAPPSLLVELSRAQSRGEIEIQPNKIFSIAETLDPLDQQHIERAFGQRVHQVYQCTEGFLGASCVEGTIHLNEDCVHIEPEWLDESKTKFIPIVTDFIRTSQPIIRYRLNDILTVRKDPCPCGSPYLAIEMIEGRADDVLYFWSATQPSQSVTVFPDFIRRAIISSSDIIEEYQVTQTATGTLSIAINAPQAYFENITQQINDQIEKLCVNIGAAMPIIQFSNELPERGNKKLRRVIRELPPVVKQI